MITDNTPSVYVGTYAKYNAGSVAGKWVDLDFCNTPELFDAACRAIHSDEADPEFMFQDFQNFPREFYGESCLDGRLWDWLELSDDDRELLAVYTKCVDQDGDIDAARDAYAGQYETKTEWAADWLENSGMLSEVPEWAQNYFDFDAYARDCEAGGDVTFARHNGALWVFDNNR